MQASVRQPTRSSEPEVTPIHSDFIHLISRLQQSSLAFTCISQNTNATLIECIRSKSLTHTHRGLLSRDQLDSIEPERTAVAHSNVNACDAGAADAAVWSEVLKSCGQRPTMRRASDSVPAPALRSIRNVLYLPRMAMKLVCCHSFRSEQNVQFECT